MHPRGTKGPETLTGSQPKSSLALEEGLMELGSQCRTPMWIWADTCSHPKCDCRSALIVATRRGKEALLPVVRTAETIRRASKKLTDLVAILNDDFAAFEVDIDTGEPHWLMGDDSTAGPGDATVGLVERHPWLGAVLGAIDGEALERLGRLWYRGKGRPDPERLPQAPSSVGGWMLGDLVSWIEAFYGVRQDIYLAGGSAYEAVENYCVMPDCACGKVLVRFDDLQRRAGDDFDIGAVNVAPSGEWTLEPNARDPELRDLLWSRYLQRHPNYRARHAVRRPRMNVFGATLVAYYVSTQNASRKKTRPNEPCPCGSGKKYKKCCWLKRSG